MSAPRAIVQAFLIPNLRFSLPYVIMLLMIQGIHPEIIFELIPYVSMSQRQYQTIILAWTQLRLFASILQAVKGVKPQTFQRQRTRFKKFPQDQVSLIFVNFQNSVLKKMLVRVEYDKQVPAFMDILNLALNLSVVKNESVLEIQTLFTSCFADLRFLTTALMMHSIISLVRSDYPEIVSFLQQNENAVKNIIRLWEKQVNVKECYGGKMLDLQEPLKINIIFHFFISAVIDEELVDESLALLIRTYQEDFQIPCSSKLVEFLKQNFGSILPISHSWIIGDIRKIVECFHFMHTTSRSRTQVRYTLTPSSIPFAQSEFEQLVFEIGNFYPILDVFSKFWHEFFEKFAQTFEVSFLASGNIPWSE